MNSLPKTLKKTIDFFEKLPGIGPKSAKRLAFYLLRIPQEELEEFGKTISDLKKKSLYCQICYNLTEAESCTICSDKSRDHSIVTIVEDVLDLLSMETGERYKGVYHVLHGKIDPLNYVGPEDIKIQELLLRIKENREEVKEIVMATNPDMEGEATAMYIKNKLGDLKKQNNLHFKVSRLAYGLPIGADLEYADYMTLQRAMEGRREY